MASCVTHLWNLVWEATIYSLPMFSKHRDLADVFKCIQRLLVLLTMIDRQHESEMKAQIHAFQYLLENATHALLSFDLIFGGV